MGEERPSEVHGGDGEGFAANAEEESDDDTQDVLGFILIYSSCFDVFLLVLVAFCKEFEFYLNWVSKILFILIHRNGMGCV